VASIWPSSPDARCASGREVAAVTAVGIEMDQADEPECLLGATANVVRIVLHTDAFWGGRSPQGAAQMPYRPNAGAEFDRACLRSPVERVASDVKRPQRSMSRRLTDGYSSPRALNEAA